MEFAGLARKYWRTVTHLRTAPNVTSHIGALQHIDGRFENHT